MVYNLSRKVPIIFGPGSSQLISQKIIELNGHKVLCITDRGIINAGIINMFLESFEAASIDVVMFDNVKPDPPDYIIEECTELALNSEIDIIIGIGGGSSLDTAKAVNTLLGNPPPLNQYYVRDIPKRKTKPMILVPTTAGTGSEVSAVSIVTDSKSNQKNAIVGDSCLADWALVDPQLTMGLPNEITTATGMDTLAHGFEALTSNAANPMSGIFALNSIALTVDNLPAVVKEESLETRTNMCLASMTAGLAFKDSNPHLGHAIAETLGAFYHIPHGIGCAVALPEIMEFIADTVPSKIVSAGVAFGLHLDGLLITDAGHKLAQSLKHFSKSLAMPTLSDLGVEQSKFDDIAEAVLNNGCTIFTPKKVSKDDVVKILNAAFSD